VLCGYGCGKPWQPWAGSKLLGHGRCLFTATEAEDILRRFEADPRLTERLLAEELGVTKSTVRATLAADPVVELTEEQAREVEALASLLAKAFEEQRLRGFREGADLLHRLARGDVKPGDYEQWSPKRLP
jgi:DNA-binding MarR family transcriptional regulator